MLMEIGIALFLDFIFPDPEWKYHPVKLIGNSIECFEKKFRAKGYTHKEHGIILVLLITFMWVISTMIILNVIEGISNIFYIIMSIGIFYFTFSQATLRRESRSIIAELEKNDIENAKKKLSRIVGRDTEPLDKTGILRAAIESISESLSDGTIGSLVYAFIGGPVLALFYRTVNTLDSMVGYDTEEYKEIGWASARLDDLLNFIPSRLTGLLIIVSGMIFGYDIKGAYSIYRSDCRKHKSPNAGHPEAAIAGLLNVKLCGPSYYEGKLEDKEWINENGRDAEIQDLKSVTAVAGIVPILAFLIMTILKLILWRYVQ